MNTHSETYPEIALTGTLSGILTSTTPVAVDGTRRGVVIQNLSTSPLFVKYGSSASASDFTFILPACTANDDGTSPAVEVRNWRGAISFYSAAYRYTTTLLA